MFVVDKSLCPDADRKYECAPFTLESLIAWLETQNLSTTYCYIESGECLWGKYVTANGGSEDVGAMTYSLRSVTISTLADKWPEWMDDVANQIDAKATFGEALSRARKYVAGTP